MDTGLDLTTASREALLAVIAQQQAVITQQQAVITQQQAVITQQQAVITELQRRLDVLEGKAKPGGSPRMPGIKPKSGQGPARDKRPRKPRPHGFARQRMAPHTPGGACPGILSPMRCRLGRGLGAADP